MTQKRSSPVLAWFWLTMFRLAMTLFVGWYLAERLQNRFLALARWFN